MDEGKTTEGMRRIRKQGSAEACGGRRDEAEGVLINQIGGCAEHPKDVEWKDKIGSVKAQAQKWPGAAEMARPRDSDIPGI